MRRQGPPSVSEAGTDNRQLIRFGIVTDCNPASLTVDVKLEDSEYITGVPIIGLYGAVHGRDLTWIHSLRGANVALIQILSQFYLLGALPSQVRSANTDSVTSLHEAGYGGDSGVTYQRDVYRNFHSGRPRDFLPGDQILRNSSGALLGLFTEGAALLKASPLCQIIMGRLKDFIRVITRRFQMFTDFGELHVEHNDQGRVGASLHGGADFSAETHPEQAKWTVQVWAGDDPGNPDNRLHIRVNDANDAEYVTIQLDQLGNLVVDTTKNREATHGKDEHISIAENRSKGVGGNETITVGGSRSAEVTANDDNTVGGNESHAVAGQFGVTAATISLSATQTGTCNFSGALTINSDAEITINAPSVNIN